MSYGQVCHVIKEVNSSIRRGRKSVSYICKYMYMYSVCVSAQNVIDVSIIIRIVQVNDFNSPTRIPDDSWNESVST